MRTKTTPRERTARVCGPRRGPLPAQPVLTAVREIRRCVRILEAEVAGGDGVDAAIRRVLDQIKTQTEHESFADVHNLAVHTMLDYLYVKQSMLYRLRDANVLLVDLYASLSAFSGISCKHAILDAMSAFATLLNLWSKNMSRDKLFLLCHENPALYANIFSVLTKIKHQFEVVMSLLVLPDTFDYNTNSVFNHTQN